jgi:hypothetical protein
VKTSVHGAIVDRPSRRQALVASGLALLACASLRGTASAAVGDQESWRFCDKCFALFFDGSGNKGKCPADGGGHTSQGFAFFPHYDDSEPSQPNVQYGWHFCSKCFEMFYNNGSTRGHCPSGGPHAAQGFDFGLNYAAFPPPSSQSQWRFCQLCFALFYDGAPNKGRCPAGKMHIAQGFVFNLPYHAAAPGALTDLLTYNEPSITFRSDIAANANSRVRLHSDGTVEFTSHFHDSGAQDYVYSISWAIYASDGTVFTLQHSGKINGHLTGGQSDRNSDYSESTVYDQVRTHWPALVRGSKSHMSAHVSGSLGGLLDTTKEALEGALKAATIYSEGFQTVKAVYNIPFLHNGL